MTSETALSDRSRPMTTRSDEGPLSRTRTLKFIRAVQFVLAEVVIAELQRLSCRVETVRFVHRYLQQSLSQVFEWTQAVKG